MLGPFTPLFASFWFRMMGFPYGYRNQLFLPTIVDPRNSVVVPWAYPATRGKAQRYK
jgi:hypothetical protein